MNSFRDVISAFGGGAALARILQEKPVTVRAWGLRDSIPPEYWPKIESKARELRIRGVNVTLLVTLAATRPERHAESAA